MRFPTSTLGKLSLALALFVVLLSAALWFWQPPQEWSKAELGILQSLSLQQLPPLPADPSNAVADLPLAAAVGKQLFFDKRLSKSSSFSCAACHRPELHFTDGLQLARALGNSRRNTPGITGAAYSPWLYWDGRKDSQWSQALAPLEDPREQGSNRLALLRVLYTDPHYRSVYEQLFGPMPDFDDVARFPEQAGPLPHEPQWLMAWQQMAEQDRQQVNQAFANLGKLLAAYERTILPQTTRFDRYVAALSSELPSAEAEQLMSRTERKGLRLFIGEARCTECHNGPLLSNHEFHNTGLLPLPGELPDKGRSSVLEQLLEDPFNCLGPYSDAAPEQCLELRYMRTGPELIGAMRTPSLRDVGSTAPYMHKGQMQTLAEVLEHYNAAPDALIGHNEATPLKLSKRQLAQLEAFLLTLDSTP